MTGTPVIRDIEEQAKGVNLIIYGDNGVGKTPWLANNPGTWILDADGGVGSAKGSGAKVTAVEEWGHLEEAYEWLRHGGTDKFNWVWLDGISIGQEKLLEGIMEDLVAAKPHRNIWGPDKGEYGQNMTRLKQWVRHMAALPINFGITAHPFRDAEPVTGEVVIMPWIQGRNMAPTICGLMDIIGYMEVIESGGKTATVIRFSKHKMYYARDRYSVLGDRQIIRIDGQNKTTLADIEGLINKAGGGTRKRPAKKAPAKKAPAKRPAKRPARK